MDEEKVFNLVFNLGLALIMFIGGQSYIYIGEDEDKWFKALGGILCAIGGALFVGALI